MEWIERFLSLVEKRIGTKAANIITWVIIVGALFAGSLWLITFTIDKLDFLATRFHINIRPFELNIQVLSFTYYLNLLMQIVFYARNRQEGMSLASEADLPTLWISLLNTSNR